MDQLVTSLLARRRADLPALRQTGSDGAYVVVNDHERTFAARVPVHETFRVYVDPLGVVRTDHALQLCNATAVRLHYKLEPTANDGHTLDADNSPPDQSRHRGLSLPDLPMRVRGLVAWGMLRA